MRLRDRALITQAPNLIVAHPVIEHIEVVDAELRNRLCRGFFLIQTLS
jgi:hypothetical protein